MLYYDTSKFFPIAPSNVSHVCRSELKLLEYATARYRIFIAVKNVICLPSTDSVDFCNFVVLVCRFNMDGRCPVTPVL
jgi:hypothetical protein